MGWIFEGGDGDGLVGIGVFGVLARAGVGGGFTALLVLAQ